MFGELPKIFDKNFALSYFFPSFIFIVVAGYLFQVAGMTQTKLPYINGELINDLSVIALFSYLGGIILLLINTMIYRFLEGYGNLNPFKLIYFFERRRYQHAVHDIELLDEEYRACIEQSKEFPIKSRMKRNELMRDVEQISR